MKENQYVEFKESWHDEYVRYVSAFCNTKGGTLFIGIDDKGRVIGLDEPKRLHEERVFSLLKGIPDIRQKDLGDKLELTEQHIRRIIKKLKDKGLIERVGS